MRAVIAILVFAAVVSAIDLESYNFKQYVSDFGRTYAEGSAEYEMREKIFNQNLAEVRAHNAGSHAYTKGINKFSDRTDGELKQLGGSGARRPVVAAKYIHKFQSTGRVLPKSVDWRNHIPNVVTAVKDQGNCGSCWAHAAIETLESHWALATGRLFDLSVQQVTSCSPNPRHCGGTGGCGGSIAELAYEYLITSPSTEEWQYPYTSYSGASGECKNASEYKPVVKGHWIHQDGRERSIRRDGGACEGRPSGCQRIRRLVLVPRRRLHRLRLLSQHHH